MLPTVQPVALPDNDTPVQVACSAGLTAVIGASGTLYTFGLNGFGQCGIGESTNNVWAPTAVTGLSTEFAADGPRSEMHQQHAVTSVALGLQHAVVLNAVGEIFAFGKGDRGQLGQESATKESHTALPIRKAYRMHRHGDAADANTNANLKPTYLTLGPVKQIASGMLHSAVLTEDNQVAIWGKHILRPTSDEPNKKALDSRIPSILTGLPEGPTVERIACGSHHTSVLLSDGSVWAVGISADTKTPMHDPVELIPKGILQLPVRQFDAHMDRTTVVGADGRQVLQVHLWSDPELREFAIFTPPYVDRLLDENETMRIRAIHRSWKHTVIVTD
jgi:alpha-tubulin suppressor-like RCC1 family protein